MRIWVNEHNTDDIIVAVSDSSVLKANPKEGELQSFVSDIQKGVLPTERTMEIPFSYIREFQVDEKKPYFDIYLVAIPQNHLGYKAFSEDWRY